MEGPEEVAAPAEQAADQLMPLYRVPESLNRRIGERFKVGIVRILLQQLGLRKWISERVLKERDRQKYPVPTGELRTADKRIAVHMEKTQQRTVKSYEKLFEAYSRYGCDEIWMIVDWDTKDFFKKTWKEFHTLWPQVWFISYKTLIREGAKSIFYNHEGENFLLQDFLAQLKDEQLKSVEKDQGAEEQDEEEY